MSVQSVRWGIIGPGKIAHKFVQGMREVPGAILHAVASRTHAKAVDFAYTYGAENAYGSYLELVQDPLVDVIYVATTNNAHYANVKLCLEHKKACLCEKPFTLQVSELEDLVSLATKNNVFLMEAMWTRFLPSILLLEKLVKQGELGEIQKIKANFGFNVQFDSESRLFNPDLGGGALYDIGIYPVFFAMHFLGIPNSISAKALKTEEGVDVENNIVFAYKNGAQAFLESSFKRDLSCEAHIFGTKGTLSLARMWHCPTQVSIKKGNVTKDITPTYVGNGYNYEIIEVHNCLKSGKTQSNEMLLKKSVERMTILNEIMRFW